MQMGMAYGSPESLAWTGAITAILCGESYRTSAELAKELGAFPCFERNREDMLRVIRNHRLAAHGKKDGYEGLTVKPMPIENSLCPAIWRN